MSALKMNLRAHHSLPEVLVRYSGAGRRPRGSSIGAQVSARIPGSFRTPPYLLA